MHIDSYWNKNKKVINCNVINYLIFKGRLLWTNQNQIMHIDWKSYWNKNKKVINCNVINYLIFKGRLLYWFLCSSNVLGVGYCIPNVHLSKEPYVSLSTLRGQKLNTNKKKSSKRYSLKSSDACTYCIDGAIFACSHV